MTLFVYVTEECQKKAREAGLHEVLERIRADVERKQTIAMFDQSFEPPYIVKKKLRNRQPRLVAELLELGDHTVVVFLTILMRHEKDYEEFSHKPLEYGNRHFTRLRDVRQLETYVAERAAAGQADDLPEPDDQENHLLYGTFHDVQLGEVNDAAGDAQIVLEAQRWVDRVREERVRRQLNRIVKACIHALPAQPGFSSHEVPELTGWRVHAYRQGNHLLLLDVSCGDDKQSETDARELVGRIEAANQTMDADDSTALLRVARRAYPALVLADDDLWTDLESEVVANLALSPEEAKVFRSVRGSQTRFPLFINGRAGSGKSTILQYLFVELLDWYAREGPMQGSDLGRAPTGPLPLYLTANRELLEVARSFVQRMLKSNAKFVLWGRDERRVQNLERLVDVCFQEFRAFLWQLLPPGRRSRFAQDRRVDYPRFRRLWRERFAADQRAQRDYGPELSWHVIRSYIKGMSVLGMDDAEEGYLDAEDYSELPHNERSVSQETFENIYRIVWPWYAQCCREQGLWDDQDLARELLNGDSVPSRYGAIFCDEAQDFTRLELELLLRLNVFSKRRLPPQAVWRVPFVFAGDEFQTLNPTGFRWEAVKSGFVEKFVFALDATQSLRRANLNYQELSNNYRSAEPIVGLANLIQAMRVALFRLSGLQPQTPWSQTDNAPVVQFFSSDYVSFWEAFRKKASNFVVIVPCEEGEETSFVAQDPVLSRHIEQIDGVPRNVLSATRAKGCEYEHVVVYGFAAHAPSALLDALRARTWQPTLSERESLELQYFMNRLYVAVSRAKRRLIVVDAPDSGSTLWHAALDEAARAKLIENLPNAQLWARQLRGCLRGRAEDLLAEHLPDRRALAENFKRDGTARSDPYLLRQAAQLYADEGSAVEASLCRALALELEGKHLEAAGAYKEAHQVENAAENFWRAGRAGWSALARLGREHASLTSDIRVRFAEALERESIQPAQALELINQLHARLQQEDDFRQCCYESLQCWREALESLLRLLANGGVGTVALPAQLAADLSERLERLSQDYGLSVSEAARVPLDAARHEWRRVRDILERHGDRESQLYLRSVAETEPYPQCLDALAQLREHERIVEKVREHGLRDSPESALDRTIEAFEALGRLDELSQLATQAGRGTVVALAKRLAEGGRREKREAVRRRLAMHYLAAEIRASVFASLEAQLRLFYPEEANSSLERILTRFGDEATRTIVESLTEVPKLTLSEASQHLLGEYLSKVFVGAPDDWPRGLTLPHVVHAFEKAGHLVSALQFCERMLEYATTESERRLLRERWLVLKFRQMMRAYEQGEGEHARRLRVDLQRHADEWGLPVPTRDPGFLPIQSLAAAPSTPKATPRLATAPATAAPTFPAGTRGEPSAPAPARPADGPPIPRRSISAAIAEVLPLEAADPGSVAAALPATPTAAPLAQPVRAREQHTAQSRADAPVPEDLPFGP
ncbi:MAG: ATP-binding domain-containing protein, partial [Casimicrobiaceae bacterium]|nr:ATP-binding domain-containing protein [Casimicrobiaceae bacterium]